MALIAALQIGDAGAAVLALGLRVAQGLRDLGLARNVVGACASLPDQHHPGQLIPNQASQEPMSKPVVGM